MAYSDFKRIDLKETFSLNITFNKLFHNIIPIPPSTWLIEALEIGQLSGLFTEKARSERLVSPVLMELLKKNNQNFTIYSGMNMDIDTDTGLKGECDFILSHSSIQDMVTAPIFTLVEAKRHDIEKGIVQCAAQLLGAQQLNKQEKMTLSTPIYGCATTGIEWRFLALKDNNLVIDVKSFYLAIPDQLLGVLQHIIDITRPKTKRNK